MKARGGAKLDRFDAILSTEAQTNPWRAEGVFEADLDLLVRLLGAAAGTSQQSGIVAAAVDVWAAEQLRRAGFDPDDVWPRRSRPRVFPRDVRNFVNGGALPKQLREQVEARLTHSKARRALPAEAHVLGSAYSKQADVVVASWAAGVELLISTKTMLSSYQKNLRNRFEEGYGDAKNLRGRHPLAALGFLYVVGADIPSSSLDFAIDMLRKLVREPDVYECACLLVIDGAASVDDDPAEDDERGPEEDPALVPLASTEDLETDEVSPPVVSTPDQDVAVRLVTGGVPDDLAPAQFFERLIITALDRMPVAMYADVRAMIAAARSDT